MFIYILLMLVHNILLYYYTKMLIKNYNLIFYFFNKMPITFNKALYSNISFNNSNIHCSKFVYKNLFFIKFLKYFNLHYCTQIHNTNESLVLYKLKNKYFFNKQIVDFLKNFANMLYTYTYENQKFLILDSNYISAYPLYKYIYPATCLETYKNFIFIKPVFFTFKNWLYFFSNFCDYNSIGLLIIYDYSYFSKFMVNIASVDCYKAGIVPTYLTSDYIDYPLYVYKLTPYAKLLYNVIIAYTYFSGCKFKQYQYKIGYLNLFYKFCTTTKSN